MVEYFRVVFRNFAIRSSFVVNKISRGFEVSVWSFLAIISGIFLSIEQAYQKTKPIIANIFGRLSDFSLILLGLLTILILCRLAYHWSKERLEPFSIDDLPAGGQFTCRQIFDEAELIQLNTVVVPKIFPDASPSLEQVSAVHKKNKSCVMGLFVDNVKIAGWAAAWPINYEAAQKLLSGRMSDDQLDADDIVSDFNNKRVKYLSVIAIAILPKFRHRGNPSSLKVLGSGFLWHIHETFLANEDDSLTLVATAYSDVGEVMCRRMGMHHNGCFTKYSNVADPKPIYQGVVNRSEIRRNIRNYFN